MPPLRLTPTFTGLELDRADPERKDAEWVQAQLRDPRARLVAASTDAILLAESDGEVHLARLAKDELDGHSDPGPPLLLGLEANGTPVFAGDLDAAGTTSGRPEDAQGHEGTTPPGTRLASLRDAGALLPGPEGALAAYLVALLGWHRRHGFCANCGEVTEVAEGGYARLCPACGATHFPRVDPVVIMLVSQGDRLLLGRQASWPQGRYSALAGFVSPGEAVEEAVAREVREESGITAYAPRFIASQPWPFPASLMLGFHAWADGGEPKIADGELEDVRWFSRVEVHAAAAGDGAAGLLLPPPIAIARFLIDRWLEEGAP